MKNIGFMLILHQVTQKTIKYCMKFTPMAAFYLLIKKGRNLYEVQSA
jgi:hypothetical protein